MNRARKTILAGLAVILAGWISGPQMSASAGARVENPETIFAKGMGWSERNGENKGVLQLNDDGSARIYWNGRRYRGHWEKVDKYRVRTTWESGGSPGQCLVGP
jgi:hypothetical protein